MILGVITATRGDSAHLDETVASVRALGVGVRHVLVCPAAACDGMERRFPDSLIVADPAGGLYPALNAGLAEVWDCDAITWVNDDDVLCERLIGAADGRLEADPAVGVVYGRVGLIDEGGASLGELPVARRPGDLAALLADGIMPLAQPGTIVRQEVAQKLRGFDASYRLAGDLDYFVRALQAGVGFSFVDAEVARFRLRAGQLSKDEAAVAAEFSRAVAPLPPGPALGARWRFRWDNRGTYLGRIRRHGFVRMSSLYRHA